ncbi:hypothetical protein B0J18DRAFT_460103 [Chaetomium sp. MPI-SDFR-AT-0129]|nr:hypothetical protein B0J18DRAFT_460103 [Chaetomium sp. MPI-SDFR-AT-0129]
MSSHGSSSTHPTEPHFGEIGIGAIEYDMNEQGTYTRMFGVPERPTWEDLLGFGQELHEHLVATRGHYKTRATSTALIATLCIARSPREYRIFQSSIPRGGWRDWIQYDGRRRNLPWYRATTAQPRHGRLCVNMHAEDGAEYLANDIYPDLRYWHEFEPPRMIVYGTKWIDRYMGVVTTQQDVCDGESDKNPSCTEVARTLGIRMPRPRIPPEDVDGADPRNPFNDSRQGYAPTPASFQTRTSSASGGGSYSGGGGSYSGGGGSYSGGGGSYSGGGGSYSVSSRSHRYSNYSNPEDAKSRHTSRRSDPADLSTAMSALSVGSRDKHSSSSSRHGGGGSRRTTASTADRDSAPQTRPSSDARGHSSSTKGQASSKSSASRSSGHSRRGE